jgi:hypothetical protein
MSACHYYALPPFTVDDSFLNVPEFLLVEDTTKINSDPMHLQITSSMQRIKEVLLGKNDNLRQKLTQGDNK